MKQLLLIIAFTFISFSVFGQVWKTYPHTPTGSLLSFPLDEGRHVNEPVEWWYTTGHIVGSTTGTHYSYMLTYFYYPFGSMDGFRILNFSNDDTEEFYTNTEFLTYDTLATDKFHIQSNIVGGGTEVWKNKTSGGVDLPFQYELNASSPTVSFDFDYDTYKRPLILGGDGLFDQGYTNYTYYYSQTGVDVTGTITFDGTTEAITGTTWIDRQFGTLNPAEGTEYEWFSIQLSNGMDINLWNIFTDENKIPNDPRFKILSAYVNDTTQMTIADFELERLEFVYTADEVKCYPQQWRLTSDSNNIDVIIETLYSNSEVLSPFRFYEGTTEIYGTVNGVSVTGVGFTELLHSYEKPDMTLLNTAVWNTTIPFVWKLNNPDDGNKITYNLEYSTDNQSTYDTIVTNLADTSYTWNTMSLTDGDSFWLKLKGQSIDGTITDSITRQFTYDSSVGINHYSSTEVEIFPIPVVETFTVKAKNIESIKILDLNGKQIKSIVGTQVYSPINIKGLSKGVYFVEIKTIDDLITKKIAVK